MVLVDANGVSYPGGVLVPGKVHRGLQVQVVVPVFSPNGSAPGSVTVNLTGLLHGTASNH
jgi:hypothetical protein